MRLSGRWRCQHARASAAVAAATARERATVPVRAVQQRQAIRAAGVVLHGSNDSFERHDTRMLPQLGARLRSDACCSATPATRTARSRGQRRCARRARGADSGQRGARRPARLQQRLVVRALARRRRRAAMLHARAPAELAVSPFASLASAAHRQYGAIGAWAAGGRFNSIAAARSHVRCPSCCCTGRATSSCRPSHALFDALPANSKHRYMLPAMQHASTPHLALVAERVHQHYRHPRRQPASTQACNLRNSRSNRTPAFNNFTAASTTQRKHQEWRRHNACAKAVLAASSRRCRAHRRYRARARRVRAR